MPGILYFTYEIENPMIRWGKQRTDACLAPIKGDFLLYYKECFRQGLADMGTKSAAAFFIK